jgi:NADP-dependent 3-hydroxy acid dehydrogenase YdfG
MTTHPHHSNPSTPPGPADLQGRTAIVTGGSTGIGRATVLALASMGVAVLTNARTEEHLAEASADFADVDTPVRTVLADLSGREGVAALFTAAERAFDRLDILVCNAAVAAGSATDSDYERMEYVVRTNLLGYLACAQAALARMRAQGEGHIVLVGSMSADVREVGSSVYVATKAGIQGFAESLRKEVNEQGIRVSLIEPGATGSDMQPDPQTHDQQARDEQLLRADDVAAAVSFCLAQPSRSDVVRLDLRPHLQLI